MNKNAMKIRSLYLLCLLLVGGISSCNILPSPVPELKNQVGDQRSNPVPVSITYTAHPTLPAIHPQVTHTPEPVSTLVAVTTEASLPRPTLELRGVDTPLPAEGSFSGPTATPANVAANHAALQPCHLAQPGRPIDVTVPDEAQFAPGEYFSKTWRLVNAGHCEWSSDFSIVWFSGENMGVGQGQTLGMNVAPGSTVDVTVEMVAPANPGLYQSNWKLRAAQGEMFGIGPNGDAPFWVRIIVVPESTPTVTETSPAPTSTPVSVLSGSLQLLPDQGADLDSGLTGLPLMEDLVFQLSQEGLMRLLPSNSARVMAFGMAEPTFEDCLLATAPSSDIPIQPDALPSGTYLCYRTTEGLPGRVHLSSFDPLFNQAVLNFITWAAP